MHTISWQCIPLIYGPLGERVLLFPTIVYMPVPILQSERLWRNSVQTVIDDTKKMLTHRLLEWSTIAIQIVRVN